MPISIIRILLLFFAIALTDSMVSVKGRQTYGLRKMPAKFLATDSDSSLTSLQSLGLIHGPFSSKCKFDTLS